jgi:hypothetical protein
MSKAKENNAVRNFLAHSNHIHSLLEMDLTAEQRAGFLAEMETYAEQIANRYGMTAAQLADLAEQYETARR